MERLYSWSAKRAGGRITITHSCGKIANVDKIAPEIVNSSRVIVATVADGRQFILHL